MINNIDNAQIAICQKYKADFVPVKRDEKVGISLSVKLRERPINGMRVNPGFGTSGWYIWTGEMSLTDDFFKPLHSAHISGWEPLIVPYLGLPPGWRFLIAENYEDVWFDSELVL